MKMILGFPLLETFCDAHDQMVPEAKGKLSGLASKEIHERIQGVNPLQRYKQIFEFFIVSQPSADPS